MIRCWRRFVDVVETYIDSAVLDTYFIALAMITNSVLITDDKPMADHAKSLGIEVILVREESLEHTREKLIGKQK